MTLRQLQIEDAEVMRLAIQQEINRSIEFGSRMTTAGTAKQIARA
jgi:hypothetical protein